jgi:hypothetical protein
MTDVAGLKQRFIAMVVADTVLLLIAAACAAAHFKYGVGWALWAFLGFLAAAFGVQVWFVSGVGRLGKGS